jgi:hypothetical protein
MNEIVKLDKNLMAGFAGIQDDGFEGVTSQDLKPNFLRIAQSTTDCAKKGHASFVKGFEPGIFYDTTTKTNMGEVLKVIVLGYFTNYVEWGQDQGDFRGSYTVGDFEGMKNSLPNFIDDKGKTHPSTWVTDEGNKIVETKNYFVLLPDYTDLDILLFTMSGTAIPQSREWVTKMNAIKIEGQRLPMFASVWELGLLMNENEKGSWYALGKKGSSKIKHLGIVPKELQPLVIEKRELVAKWINENKSINYKTDETFSKEEATEY